MPRKKAGRRQRGSFSYITHSSPAQRRSNVVVICLKRENPYERQKDCSGFCLLNSLNSKKIRKCGEPQRWKGNFNNTSRSVLWFLEDFLPFTFLKATRKQSWNRNDGREKNCRAKWRQNTWFMAARVSLERNVTINLVLWKLSQSFKGRQWNLFLAVVQAISTLSEKGWKRRRNLFSISLNDVLRRKKNTSPCRETRDHKKLDSLLVNWVSSFLSSPFELLDDFLTCCGLSKVWERKER